VFVPPQPCHQDIGPATNEFFLFLPDVASNCLGFGVVSLAPSTDGRQLSANRHAMRNGPQGLRAVGAIVGVRSK